MAWPSWTCRPLLLLLLLLLLLCIGLRVNCAMRVCAVIFDAGLGTSSDSWRLVYEEISKFTKVETEQKFSTSTKPVLNCLKVKLFWHICMSGNLTLLRIQFFESFDESHSSLLQVYTVQLMSNAHHLSKQIEYCPTNCPSQTPDSRSNVS